MERLFPILRAAVIVPLILIGSVSGGNSGEPRFERRTFVDARPGERRYVVFVPRGFSPGDRRPVILFLNGFGENGTDGIRQISNNFGFDVWRLRDCFPFVVVAPQCSTKDGSWSLDGHELRVALAMLDEVEKKCGTDPDRVYLTGVSDGGTAAFELGSSLRGSRFAAIVPISAFGGANAAMLAMGRMPIWSFSNDFDQNHLVNANRSMRLNLIGEGASPFATEYHFVWDNASRKDDEERHDAWTRGYAHTPLYSWLLRQRRSADRTTVPLFQPVSLADAVANWTRTGGADWRIEQGLLSGVSDAPAALISPPGAEDFEFHVDAQFQTGCAIGLYADADQPELRFVVSLPFVDEGFGAIVTPDGKWMARLDPVAQRQLDGNGWNDLRVARSGDHFSVTINGSSAMAFRDAELLRGVSRYGLLASTIGDEPVRWRNLRWRSHKGSSEVPTVTDELVTGEPAVTGAAVDVGAITVDDIASAWRKIETERPTGEIQWRVRRDDSTLFGGYPRLPAPEGDDAERLRFSGPDWQFDGWQTSPIAIGKTPLPRTDADLREQFRLLLASGELPAYTPTETLDRCSAWSTPGKCSVLWRTPEYPRALIASGWPSADIHDAGRRKPGGRCDDLALEGALLATRPASAGPLRRSSSGCRLETPKDRSRVILEVPENEGDGIRQYWLDPRLGYSIVRMIDRTEKGPHAQIDIRYDVVDGRPLPVQWIVMTFDDYLDVARFAVLDRIAAGERGTVDPPWFPPDTWVLDRTSGESFIAGPAGRRLLHGEEFASDARYEDLLGHSWLALTPARLRSLRAFLAAALRWPSILVTLACIATAGWGLRMAGAFASRGRLFRFPSRK